MIKGSSLPSGLEFQQNTFAGRLWVVAMCMEIKGVFLLSPPPTLFVFCVGLVVCGVNTDVEIEGVVYFPACLLPISGQESKVWHFFLILFFRFV